MHQIFHDMLYKGVIVYLDDILVYSSSEKGHDVLLEEVFSRIASAGLKINPQKCRLKEFEVRFLGHVVSSKGIETFEDKI